MAYTALYRNFRPLKFSDMVGQDHITRTLRNQIMADRVGHAYLFNGGRGTGKTTSAKILARAVNCLNPQDGEPCNECEICKEILDGSLTDVVEMDAASNNSVEDIRSIRDEVNFLPTKAKYRVYIIDEVHMLSPGAFNALLKTLEEPPEHVKFILATTEPQKLPTTILSRCQRFDFKKIPEADIIKRLKIICTEANINANDEALKIIAVLSEGHMRDAISILERCSQENTDNIRAEEVKELVGLPRLEYINKLAQGILEYDSIKSLEAIDDVINDGKDLYNFLWELIKYFKDILVYKTTNKLQLYSEEEIKGIKALADITSEQRLLDTIYLLSDLENDLKWSSQKTIMFQTGVLKACRKNVMSGNLGDDLERRLQAIEQKIENLKIIPNTGNNIVQNKVQEFKEITKTNNVSTSSTTSQTGGKTADVWKRVVESLKRNGKIRLYTALINTRINEVNDLVWEVEFPNGLTSFNQKILEDVNNNNELKKEIFKVTGKEIHLKFKDGKTVSNPSSQGGGNSKSPINNLGIDINIIE
jgi:DNA polymerase-3 subunit gamma/tau